ncbi:serine protease [Salinispora sp. H7-4]|uniref:trypsin-like serine peptidase n=1 Tax=Salinispora sp. H7-4 TaxID=2748321 RepID=UPI0015D20C70|nr:hypothetical protein [Salinispora sp. H7-4]NYT93570.1 hypothetical protein [Salinispora sp. H7-4]
MKPPLRWSAAAGITLALIATGPVNANPAPTTTDPDSIASSVALTKSNRMVASDETINEVIEYWTPERMNNAVPLEVEGAPTATRQAPQPDGPPTIVSSPVPPSTTHNRNNAINTRSIAVGILYFVSHGEDSWCSASTVSSAKGRLISTAGHCLHPGGDKNAPWHSNVVFVPAFDSGKEPYGKWAIVHKWSFRGWTENGKYTHNIGFAETAAAGDGTTVVDRVGAHGLYVNAPVQKTTLVGYNGGLWGDDDPNQYTCEDGSPIHSVGTIAIACAAVMISAGGPYLINFDAGSTWGWLTGVARSTNLTGTAYGTYFDTKVRGLYDDAEEASDG